VYDSVLARRSRRRPAALVPPPFAFEPVTAGDLPVMQLLSREARASETSAKLDALHRDLCALRLELSEAHAQSVREARAQEMEAKLEDLRREVSAQKIDLKEIETALTCVCEAAEQRARVHNLIDREERARLSKAEDAQRLCQEIKVRLDRIEEIGPRGDYHNYATFQSVSRRLAELGQIEKDFKRVERDLRLGAILFCAAVLVWMLALTGV